MKKSFTTGLAILLPAVLTLLIVSFVVNFLTKPFISATESILRYIGLDNYPYLMNGSAPLQILSKTLILLSLIFLTLGIGFLGRWVFVHYVFKASDYVIHQLPVINKIYKASKDVVQSFVSSTTTPFSQVVFVPFPDENTLSVGLITQEAISIQSELDHPKTMLSVFVPGTPNPAMGFMLMFRREQLIFVDMKVEDAMKFIVSCGVIMSDFSMISTPENQTPFSADEHSSKA